MLLRGLVFGRHGRVFKEPDIQRYLGAQRWYEPDPDFSNRRLGQRERTNLDLIRAAEAAAHEYIQPGDLRWWRERRVTPEALGDHGAAEWRIMIAEVEAIHGKSFADDPWLQDYFDERYWYTPRTGYEGKELGAIERENLSTMHDAQRHQRHLAISPGDMEYFTGRAITADMLHGLSLFELRLLRNEVYARHGRVFHTAWLQGYFEGQSWYVPGGDGADEATLSAIEAQNVATIASYEGRLHESLASQPLDAGTLEGLFVEDARKLRNEIYARHGRPFEDPWLAGYFASFDWYHADPRYDDRMLTAIELRNVATILAYEETAASEADTVEG
jgi:hypothetical protein